MENWREIFVEPTKGVLTQVGQFVMGALLVILILFIGWLISKALKVVITKLLKALKLDELSSKMGLAAIFTKGGINYTLSELIGSIFYWSALLITFVVALNSVGLTVAADLLQRILLYIPNIISAIFILIVGMFVSIVLQNIVKTAASNAGISYVNLIGKIVEVVIIVFAIAMALEQLQIGARIVELTISIVLGSFGLGFALALGLGCKDIVAQSAERLVERLKK